MQKETQCEKNVSVKGYTTYSHCRSIDINRLSLTAITKNQKRQKADVVTQELIRYLGEADMSIYNAPPPHYPHLSVLNYTHLSVHNKNVRASVKHSMDNRKQVKDNSSLRPSGVVMLNIRLDFNLLDQRHQLLVLL